MLDMTQYRCNGVALVINSIHQTYLPSTSPPAVLNDPTYGGVSASYAMQADIRIAMSDARIGKEREVLHGMSWHVMACHVIATMLT